MDTTDALLAERAHTHGDFTDHAEVTVALKRAAALYGRNYDKLGSSHREAFDMILHKLGRICAGDPQHRDHWDDIAGYARLAAERCKWKPPLVEPSK